MGSSALSTPELRPARSVGRVHLASPSSCLSLFLPPASQQPALPSLLSLRRRRSSRSRGSMPETEGLEPPMPARTASGSSRATTCPPEPTARPLLSSKPPLPLASSLPNSSNLSSSSLSSPGYPPTTTTNTTTAPCPRPAPDSTSRRLPSKPSSLPSLSSAVPPCADCAGVNPFINPFDASHRNPAAFAPAPTAAPRQQFQQTFQQPQQFQQTFQQPQQFAAPATRVTPEAPRNFFPPGQLQLNRFENGFNFDFTSQ